MTDQQMREILDAIRSNAYGAADRYAAKAVSCLLWVLVPMLVGVLMILWRLSR